jgi:hypothetical protein
MTFLYRRASPPLVSLWPRAPCYRTRSLAFEKAAMASLSFGWVFGLGQARRFGEPHRGQAHMASVQTFMLRLAFVASVLLLALLIAYLAG